MRKEKALLVFLLCVLVSFFPRAGFGGGKRANSGLFLDPETSKVVKESLGNKSGELKKGAWVKYRGTNSEGESFLLVKKYLGTDEEKAKEYLGDEADGLVYGWFEEVFVREINSKPDSHNKIVMKKLMLIPELSSPEKLKNSPPPMLLSVMQQDGSDPLIIYEYKPGEEGEEEVKKPEEGKETAEGKAEENGKKEKKSEVRVETSDTLFSVKEEKIKSLLIKVYRVLKNGKERLESELVLPKEPIPRASLEAFTYLEVKQYDEKGREEMTLTLVDMGDNAKSEIVGTPRKMKFNFPIMGGMRGMGGM